MSKAFYVVTVPHSTKISIAEKMSDAEEIAENWRRDGFSTLIETVREDELTKNERNWLGLD